jgi:predicted metal-dependent hydrolase
VRSNASATPPAATAPRRASSSDENQRLARASARAEIERQREHALQVAAVVAKAGEARVAHDAAVAQVAGDRRAMAEAQASLSELDHALAGLRRLEVFGQLRAAEQAAALAAQSPMPSGSGPRRPSSRAPSAVDCLCRARSRGFARSATTCGSPRRDSAAGSR